MNARSLEEESVDEVLATDPRPSKLVAYKAELTCSCGCRYRCPRCDSYPPISLLIEAEVYEATRETVQPRSPEELTQDPAAWIQSDEAAAILATTPASFKTYSRRVSEVVRRRRVGHVFEWYRPDVEALAALRKIGIGLESVLRIGFAQRSGELEPLTTLAPL